MMVTDSESEKPTGGLTMSSGTISLAHCLLQAVLQLNFKKARFDDPALLDHIPG